MRVIDLPEQTERFLTREELEQIQKRLQLVPPGDYSNNGSEVIGGECGIILEIKRLGTVEFYTHANEDVRKLINHVLLADKENDRLLQINQEQKSNIELLSKKIQELQKANKYDEGDWITDW